MKKTSEVVFPKIAKNDLRGLFAVLLVLSAGCGRKSLPLAPLRPAPAAVTNVSARRLGDHIEIHFTLPTANQDRTTPVALQRVDVYARSTPEGSPVPTSQQVIERANLVGSVSVRPPVDDDAPPPDPDAPKDDRPAAGEATLFVDDIPAGEPLPLPQPKHKPPPAPLPPPIVLNPLAPKLPPPPPPKPPTRYLMLVGVSPKNRQGPAAVIGVPLTPPGDGPTDLQITYDETTVTLTWEPAADDQKFNVYDADSTGRELSAVPLTKTPLSDPIFTMPVEFEKERCLSVRGVETKGNVSIETDPVLACKTPHDTFPPPSPAGLAAIPETGFITITWDSVKAADLAGYIVLRSDGTSDRLQPLTSDPIAQTSYKDATVRAGVTYVYAVVAVDRSTPPNRSAISETKTVTAR